MKRLQTTILSILCIGFCFSQTGTIKGLVFDPETNEGIKYASISLEGGTTGTLTDENGNFELENLPYGEYNLKAELIGHGDTTIMNLVISKEAMVILEIGLSRCEYEIFGKSTCCPLCNKSDLVIPISYDPPSKTNMKKVKRGKLKLAERTTHCDPDFYCQRDGKAF